MVSGCSSAASAPAGEGVPPADAGATPDTAVPVAVDAGSGETAAPHCAYPQGSYATATGSIAPPSLSWQCFAPGATDPTTLSITDLFDCDGTAGIGAVVFDESATWCTDCQTE